MGEVQDALACRVSHVFLSPHVLFLSLPRTGLGPGAVRIFFSFFLVFSRFVFAGLVFTRRCACAPVFVACERDEPEAKPQKRALRPRFADGTLLVRRACSARLAIGRVWSVRQQGKAHGWEVRDRSAAQRSAARPLAHPACASGVRYRQNQPSRGQTLAHARPALTLAHARPAFSGRGPRGMGSRSGSGHVQGERERREGASGGRPTERTEGKSAPRVRR